MKKLFPDKKLFSKKDLLEFLDKKGFYVVLLLCIVVVGVTAIIVTTRGVSLSNREFESENLLEDTDGTHIPGSLSGMESSINDDIDHEEEVNVPVEEQEVAATEPPAETGEKGGQEVSGIGVSSVDNTSDQTQSGKSSESSGSKKAPTQNFIMPVNGEVTFEFAVDRLVYSKTLEEWRTHSGVDLAADRGSKVKCVADGVVSAIKNDPQLGIMVIVEHSNGLQTVYANLASEDAVVPNQKVKQGDIIGSVGNTAFFETAEETHLHFEVWKDGKEVDPVNYLPIKDKNVTAD